jgi:hypothetical protein
VTLCYGAHHPTSSSSFLLLFSVCCDDDTDANSRALLLRVELGAVKGGGGGPEECPASAAPMGVRHAPRSPPKGLPCLLHPSPSLSLCLLEAAHLAMASGVHHVETCVVGTERQQPPTHPHTHPHTHPSPVLSALQMSRTYPRCAVMLCTSPVCVACLTMTRPAASCHSWVSGVCVCVFKWVCFCVVRLVLPPPPLRQHNCLASPLSQIAPPRPPSLLPRACTFVLI